jgi:hypothetical protein
VWPFWLLVPGDKKPSYTTVCDCHYSSECHTIRKIRPELLGQNFFLHKTEGELFHVRETAGSSVPATAIYTQFEEDSGLNSEMLMSSSATRKLMENSVKVFFASELETMLYKLWQC